jgi:S1-C subfamily serine protease
MTHTVESSSTGALAELSEQLASAVEIAGASVARVEARRGNAASGIVWTAEGHILTADHALEREEDITVGLGDGRSLAATLVARDPGTDLALLKVDAADLTPAPRAEDGQVRVGHLALAIGRPGPAGVMASMGVVSALGGAWRTARGGQLDGFVRTDAMLYPGFSGGPLVDASGRVMAINSWTLSQGAGLAIPAGTAVRVAQALLSGGVKRAYLGVGAQTVRLPSSVRSQLEDGPEHGLMLITVEQDGPAEKAGLLIGDVLLAMDGHALADTEDLLGLLTSDRAGQPATVRLVRGGEVRELAVRVGERS